MRVEVTVLMQVQVPEDTNLDDLQLEIDPKGGIRFTSQGKAVADASDIEDYYIDDVDTGEGDWEELEDSEGDDEE